MHACVHVDDQLHMRRYVPSVPAPLRGPYHVAPPLAQPAETVRGRSSRRQLMARAAKATKEEEAMLDRS
jgi:hypothetical protein